MSAIQKLVAALLPKKWAENMEAASRNWMARCSTCGFERSFWDAGGIRWKAAGKLNRYLFCPKCGRARWHAIYKRQTNDVHAKTS